jgi:HPt (histidine-containing phosphotransfer) domain-containing protein
MTTHASSFAPAEFSIASQGTPAPRAADTRKTGSMRNVFLLVGVAIVVFMAFTAYSIRKEMQGSAQLAAIKDLYFPMLQRLDANIVRIDKIEANFIETAVTGDKDLIEKAKDVGTEADQAYVEIEALDPTLKARITSLREDLKSYEDQATKASLAFLSSSGADTNAMKPMNDALAKARADLTAFRKASYDEFVRTLTGSQKEAHTRLLMSLALGFMNLCFMAVLVYFIRNNMKMMTVIAQQNATLEQRVAERTAELSQKTADINAMLQNMKLGVCAVTTGNLIHPEYSTHLRTIFGDDSPGGKDLLQTLFRDSTLGVDVRDQISVALGSMLGEDAMMFDLNGHLLPTEMQLGAGEAAKLVRMDWSPIVSPETGVIDKILLISEDVTHLRALELSAAQQKEELTIISRIIRISVGKFNEFIDSANGFITANRQLITAAQNREQADVPALFRNMHTIKGNARTFEFTQITDAAHRTEQSYDRLRKDPTAQFDAKALLSELADVEAAVSLYNKVNEEKLGRKGRAADVLTTRGAYVGNEQLAELRAMAAALVNRQRDTQTEQLQRYIDGLGLISLSRLVSGSVDSLASVCNELQKPVPAVDIQNGELGFNSKFAEALKSSLMHIVRNALDHGIETPADRARANKPERGTLRVACERSGNGHVELRVGDDGRGLALHKLYEKGVANGAFNGQTQPSRQDVADLVFSSGLSTAEQVTQVSGRGVGMDAVRVFMREQGASVRIALKDSATDLGFAPFEFVITVPETASRHAA